MLITSCAMIMLNHKYEINISYQTDQTKKQITSENL